MLARTWIEIWWIVSLEIIVISSHMQWESTSFTELNHQSHHYQSHWFTHKVNVHIIQQVIMIIEVTMITGVIMIIIVVIKLQASSCNDSSPWSVISVIKYIKYLNFSDRYKDLISDDFDLSSRRLAWTSLEFTSSDANQKLDLKTLKKEVNFLNLQNWVSEMNRKLSTTNLK